MHLLVVANETVTGRKLIEAVERHRGEDLRVTVIAPVNQPERGYVVYEDTRRAAAGRRPAAGSTGRSRCCVRKASRRTGWSSKATPSPPCATRLRSWNRPSTS